MDSSLGMSMNAGVVGTDTTFGVVVDMDTTFGVSWTWAFLLASALT